LDIASSGKPLMVGSAAAHSHTCAPHPCARAASAA
jgi:hypothetical protein